MKMAREYDQRTASDEDKTKHTIPVCILCDRFIMGVEKIMYINKMTLQQHVSRLGVDSFESYYSITLHPELVKQYEVDTLPGFLLLPRARKCDDKYEACSTCMNGMKLNMINRVMLLQMDL